ncbi:MAG: hypothetical protein CMJ68_01630 [Planctomycetaceae bacterium]|nr:hypothetical protein [Planctomycetaceae bacterium]
MNPAFSNLPHTPSPVTMTPRFISWAISSCPQYIPPLVANSVLTGQTGSPAMQVVSCRVNEGLVIDHEISVTVLDVQETHVRLGISSPNQTPSYREETLFCESAEPAAELQLQ